MTGPKCWQVGDCFARDQNGRCTILSSGYNLRKCNFQKKEKEVTNGKKYPFRNYGSKYGNLAK